LEENPYLYDAHVSLITTARELGDLDALRSARQNMSELFPLSEGKLSGFFLALPLVGCRNFFTDS